LAFFKLAQLHGDKVDQQHNFRLLDVNLFVKCLAEPPDQVLASGAVLDLEQELVLGEGVSDISFLVVATQRQIDEDVVSLRDELGFQLNLRCCGPTERNLLGL
jgi:hypothetical protein